MATATRREFLGGFGVGLLALRVGPTGFGPLGLFFEEQALDPLDPLYFGDLEPLVALMQETDPEALLPLLVQRLRAGTELSTLVTAGALANARTHGGMNYDGYHAFMALAPALEMARRLPEPERPLPVLKVLYRNTAFVRAAGGRAHEALRQVEPAAAPADGLVLREHLRARDLQGAERAFATLTAGPPAGAWNALQPVIQDDVDVHRIVLAWRAWDMLSIAGERHAGVLLRQSLCHCVQREEQRTGEEPSIRRLLPELLESLASRPPGTRAPDDAALERLAGEIFAAERDDGARAMAAALAEFQAAALGEALSLAAVRLLLQDPGRSRAEEGKPVGSVHGASVGLHACDAARAWRCVARSVAPEERAATLIAGAYHTAGQSGRVGAQDFPWRERRADLSDERGDLPRQLEEAIRGSDQALAVAACDRAQELGLPEDDLLALFLRHGLAADGALHAEKYFATAVQDLAEARPAFRRRHLLALARVTASEHGFPAPGLSEARELLGV